MNTAELIEKKVQQAISLNHFELLNESDMHAGSATESHFKLIAVSDEFTALSLVKRHQRIYKLLQEELASTVHALALHLYSLEEWEVIESSAPDSPKCSGKNK